MIYLTNTEIHITIHVTHKMKPVDAKPNTCIDFHVENNNKDPKFKTGDQVTISKDIVKRLHSQFGLKKFLLLEKVKNTVLCKYVIEDLNGK